MIEGDMYVDRVRKLLAKLDSRTHGLKTVLASVDHSKHAAVAPAVRGCLERVRLRHASVSAMSEFSVGVDKETYIRVAREFVGAVGSLVPHRAWRPLLAPIRRGGRGLATWV